jgi:hypothetical protein
MRACDRAPRPLPGFPPPPPVLPRAERQASSRGPSMTSTICSRLHSAASPSAACALRLHCKRQPPTDTTLIPPLTRTTPAYPSPPLQLTVVLLAPLDLAVRRPSALPKRTARECARVTGPAYGEHHRTTSSCPCRASPSPTTPPAQLTRPPLALRAEHGIRATRALCSPARGRPWARPPSAYDRVLSLLQN